MKHLAIFMLLITCSFAQALTYELMTPQRIRPNPTLVTLLHGCTQTIRSARGLTHLEKFVESKNVILLMPAQSFLRNPMKCWNWFTPQNNNDAYGELASIKLLIEKTMETYRPKASYLYGFSAGAAMSSNLIALSSELFDGVLIHSGFPHQGLKSIDLDVSLDSSMRAVSFAEFYNNLSLNQQQGVLSLRSYVRPLHSRLKHIIIASGVEDKIAPYRHSKSILMQFSDGVSVLTAKRFDHYNVYRTSGNDRNVYLYEFLDMGHAWSGGNPSYLFASPDTLDITAESFKIFGL